MFKLPKPASATHKANDPYDADKPFRMACACGQAHDTQGLDTQSLRDRCPLSNRNTSGLPNINAPSIEHTSQDFMEGAFVKALFPVDSVRRGFIKAVGVNAAKAAIASVMPLGDLQAMAEERGANEKKDL